MFSLALSFFIQTLYLSLSLYRLLSSPVLSRSHLFIRTLKLSCSLSLPLSIFLSPSLSPSLSLSLSISSDWRAGKWTKKTGVTKKGHFCNPRFFWKNTIFLGFFLQFSTKNTSIFRGRCHIYIYMVVGSFAAANFAIFGTFPNFIVKMAKRDVANLPHLSFYVFGENDPKRAWDCSPKHLLKKDTGTAVPGLFLGSFGFQSYFLLIWQKKRFKSQKC